VLGVNNGLCVCVLATGTGEGELGGDKGLGGGKTTPPSNSSTVEGEEETPRPANKLRLSAATSWRRATFSDLEEPSSERMAEMRASRSEMSASRVDMYSV
jgi:hypothetical protein